MAHKGKYWPVHFRRDMTLNCGTSWQRFAASYYLTPRGLLGSLGSALNGRRINCINQSQPTPDSLAWSSNNFLITGATVYARIVMEIQPYTPGNHQFNSMRYELLEASGVLLFARQYFSYPELPTYGLSMSEFANTTTSTPPLIFDTGASGGEAGPIPWN